MEIVSDEQALYHCPNNACRKDFKNLASIVNHLESESCGYLRFDAVQKKMANLTNGRLLKF